MALDPFGPNEGLDPAKPVEGLDPFAPDPNAPGPFKQGLGAGVAGVKSSMAGAGALAAHAVGAVETEKAALDYAAQQSEIAAAGARKVEDVDWTSPAAVAQHFKYLLGNAIPSLSAMVVGGVLGRGLGRGLGAVSKASPAATAALTRAGTFAGAVAPDVALEAGSIYPEALKTGVEAPALRAAAGGAVAASLDFLPLLAAEKYLKAAGRGGFGAMAKKALIGAPVGAALEGTQELGQAVIERAAAGLDMTGPEAVSDYINSFAGGAAPGALFGAGIGAARGRAAPAASQPAPPPEPAPTVSPEPPVSPAVEKTYPLSPEDEASIAHANLVTAHDAAATQAAAIEQQLGAVADVNTRVNTRLEELKAELAKPLGERRTKEEILAERKGLQAEAKASKVGLEELGGVLKAHRDTIAKLAPQIAEADQREAARVALANTPSGLNPAISPKLGTESPNLGRFAEPATPQERIDRAVKGVHALFREQGMPLTTTMESLATPIMSPREAALAKVEGRAPRETVKGPSTAQMQAVEPHAMQVIEPMAKALAEAKTKTPEGQAKIATNLAAAMREVVQESAKLYTVGEAQAYIVNRMPAALKGHGVSQDAEDIAKAVAAAVGQASTVYSKGATSRGRWYTDLYKHAEGFALAQRGRVKYVDIPEALVEPTVDMGTRITERGKGEHHILPAEYTAQAKEFDRESPPAPPADGFVRMYRGASRDEPLATSRAALTQDEFDALPPQGQERVVDEYNRIMAAKGAALIANLKGLIGNDPFLTITTFQAKPGDPIGSYTRVGPLKSLIALATNAKDGLSVADHEGYHYAEERLLNSEERAVVRNALLPGRPLFEKLMESVRRYDLENQTNLADEVSGSPREAHAYAFEFWRRGELQAEGRLAQAWEKIKQVLRQIAQFVTGQGFTTIEDVFTALDRGQFAQRQQAGIYGDVFNGPDGVPALSRADPERWYRSALTDQVSQLPMKSGTAQAWREQIKGLVAKGAVKQAEIDAVGLEEFLDIQSREFKLDDYIGVLAKKYGGYDEQRVPKFRDDTLTSPEYAELRRLQAAKDDKAKITRDEVVSFLREHGVQVEEVVLGEGQLGDLDDAAQRQFGINYDQLDGDEQAIIRTKVGTEAPTKYADYQLPGGTQYRELLLRLPSPEVPARFHPDDVEITEPRNRDIWVARVGDQQINVPRQDAPTAFDAQIYAADRFNRNTVAPGSLDPNFTAPHFGEHGKNLLAHVRLNSRVDASGARILFLEEIQSDWAQKGKKQGFAVRAPVVVSVVQEEGHWIARDQAGDVIGGGPTEALARESGEIYARKAKGSSGVARAPFVTKTDAWVALVLKRMIRYAIETGHEKIAWTTGEQQVSRYTNALRKNVDAIEWTKTKDGVHLVGYKGEKSRVDEFGYQRAIADVNQRIRAQADIDAGNPPGFPRSAEMLSLMAERRELQAEQDNLTTRVKVVDTNYQENELSDAIGKAMADRIRQDPNPTGTIEGENIKIDDTGMAGFYERIVPKVANEVLRKLDKTVKVGEVQVLTTEAAVYRDATYGTPSATQWHAAVDGATAEFKTEAEANAWVAERSYPAQPGFQLTPELVRAALNGLPLFSRAAAAPGAVVNIGLAVKGGGEISLEEALSALGEMGVHAQAYDTRQSATEPTLIAWLDRALTPAEAHRLAVVLKQEAIAQVAGGVGELYGPNAAAWQPFNPAYFLGLDTQHSRAAINPALPAYGRARPGSVSTPAVHFSPTEGLTYITSERYGTGLKGAERARGAGPRVHFYVPQGYGVAPEKGVGEHAYGVHLANLYDADADPQRLWAQGKEQAVSDAGFDGYLARGSSTAVLLGSHSVPVMSLGTGARAANERLGSLAVPPAVYDQNRLLAEDLIRDKRLPGGMLRPSQWQDVIRKVAPDLYARLPTSIYEGTAPVYRDQLIGAFYKNAPIDITNDGLGAVLHNLTPAQQTSYSRAAITANADMAREMSAGELQQAQLFQTSAKMMDAAMERGSDNLGKLALGALSTEVSGGISRWWQKNIATPNFVSRISRGYRNVFQVLNTYVRYRNDLVERMLIQKIPQWYTASAEDQHVAFNALNKRNVGGYTTSSQELRDLMAGLTEKQRGMFVSATQMFEGFLRMELESDKAFHQRVYVTPGLYEKWLADRSAQVQELIAKGYMPLRRYGDHSVRVTMDTVSADGRPEQLVGALQWFGTARAAYATAKIYEEEIKRSGVELKVEVGMNYKAARDVTISAEQFLDTARRNGVPLTAMEKERLVKALTSADSLTRNRMLHREGVPGYSLDGMRVMNEFGMRMAGKLAYSRFAGAIDAASDGRAVTTDVVGGVPQIQIDLHREGESVGEFKARNLWKLEGPMSGFHHNLADELTDYVLVPDHTGGWSRKLRGAAMMYFIGGSLSAGVVNTMSVPMMVVPELSIHTDYATSLATTLGAWKTTWQYQHILRDIERLKSNEAADAIPGVSPELRAALVEAAQYTMDTELHQIMGISQGAAFSQNQRVQRAMKVWMAPFRITEQTNRITAFIAAYKVASATGVRQADGSFRRLSGPALFRFARDMIDSTQNNYNETNRPGAARNPIFALMFMFKSFPLFMTEAIALMYKANPKSAVYMLLGLTAMTGVQGLPFAETIQDLIDTIAQQLFGSPFNTRRAMRNMVKTASEAMVGYDASELVLRGVINGVLGVSASSRIGAGDFVPGTRLGTADADQGRILQAALGAPYAMVKDSLANVGKLATLDWKQAADALRAGGPVAVRNAIKGIEQLSNGYASDSKGRRLVDINGMEAMLQMAGLSSAGLARTYELENINRQVKAFYTQVSTDMKDKLVRAMKDGDTERVQEINDLRAAWNQRYPEMPILINPSALRRDLALSGLPMDRRSQMLWARRIRGENMFSEQ